MVVDSYCVTHSTCLEVFESEFEMKVVQHKLNSEVQPNSEASCSKARKTDLLLAYRCLFIFFIVSLMFWCTILDL